MTWLALPWLWWSLPAALPYDPPLPRFIATGRIVQTRTLHLGVRPATDDWMRNVAVTVQITAQALSL